MKSTIVVICVLMLNSVFALDLPNPALKKSTNNIFVVMGQATALEKLVSYRFRGKRPLAASNDMFNLPFTPQKTTTIAKLNIMRDLLLLIFDGMQNLYNCNPKLFGIVPSLNAVQSDIYGNVDIQYNENVKIFPCLESQFKIYGNRIYEIAKKSPQELNNSDTEFREKIINKCIGLFIIQLFLNKDLDFIAQSLITEEEQLMGSMNATTPEWGYNFATFYRSTHRSDTFGIYRIANLALANIAFLYNDNFCKLSQNAFQTIFYGQKIFSKILTEVEDAPNFQSMRELIKSVNSHRIIIRSNLYYMYNNTFEDRLDLLLTLFLKSEATLEEQNQHILRKLMLEVCVKPNYIDYNSSTAEKDSVKKDEFTYYMMEITPK